MTDKRSDPPGLAVWWLQYACPAKDNEALTGDLIERFREGKTRGWFWRQVLIAFAVGVLGEIRVHWPYFCYSIIGTALSWFYFAAASRTVWGWLHRSEWYWPWSELALELGGSFLLALAALSVLAAGLIIERSFHWIWLARTAAASLVLITLGHFSIDFFPWLLHPDPAHPGARGVLIIPVGVQVLLSFSAFLAAAWLGCLSPWPNAEPERQAKP